MHDGRADEPRRHDCAVMRSKVLTLSHRRMRVAQKGEEKNILAFDILRSGEGRLRFCGFPPTPSPTPPPLPPGSDTKPVFLPSGYQDSRRKCQTGLWFCLAIIFYLSITRCTVLLRSQELSWHRCSLKQLWKLLSSPVWGFHPFSLNIYIGTTCWNM